MDTELEQDTTVGTELSSEAIANAESGADNIPESVTPKKSKKRVFIVVTAAVLFLAVLGTLLFIWPGFIPITKTEYIYDDSGAIVGYWEIRPEFRKSTWKHFDADGVMEFVHIREYDKGGLELKRYMHSPDGELEWFCEYEYDESGNIIKDSYFTPDGDLDYSYGREYDENRAEIKTDRFDADGKLEYSYEFNSDGSDLRRSYYYDDHSQVDVYGTQGTVVLSDYRDIDGMLTHSSEFGLDGKETRRTVYNKNGIQIDEYAPDGSVVLSSFCTPGGILERTLAFKAEGNVEKQYYPGGGLKGELHYNASNRLLWEVYYSENGSLSSKRECEYSGGGSLTRKLFYRADGKLEKEINFKNPDGVPGEWEYFYDDEGEFLYKEGTVASFGWSWSDDRVILSSYRGYPLLLEKSIENCVGFTLDFKISSVDYGSPYGTQSVYIKDDAGSWKKVGSLDAPSYTTVTVKITLDSLTTFSSVFVLPSTSKNTSWHCLYHPYNLIIRSTEYTEPLYDIPSRAP